MAQGLGAPGRLWKRPDLVQCGERTRNPHIQRIAPFVSFICSQRSWNRDKLPLHPSLPVIAWPWRSSFFDYK